MTPAEDADDCARYLNQVGPGENWRRFDAAIHEFLIRHKDVNSTGTLRTTLADAYAAVVPADHAAINASSENEIRHPPLYPSDKRLLKETG